MSIGGDECDDPDAERKQNLSIGRWNAAVKASINGKKGQRLLARMATALDAMPEKVLGTTKNGKGLPTIFSVVDPECSLISRTPDEVSTALGVSPTLIWEISIVNDQQPELAPSARWAAMRRWVRSRIKPDPKDRGRALQYLSDSLEWTAAHNGRDEALMRAGFSVGRRYQRDAAIKALDGLYTELRREADGYTSTHPTVVAAQTWLDDCARRVQNLLDEMQAESLLG